jgi:predicted SnoaL-like aldol condensation-catalyzing enzyme
MTTPARNKTVVLEVFDVMFNERDYADAAEYWSDRYIQDGKLAEHWGVLQDEATRAESLSGLPMFGDEFPPER